VAVPSAAIEMDKNIDWSKARLIAVQGAGRYKTLDSFARESMSAMYGKESLPKLGPMGSLFEWLFNREAYDNEPVIKIKDKGLRIHFSSHMQEMDRKFIQQKKYMTPRQFRQQEVQDRIRELEPRFEMVSAIGRVRDAEAIALSLERLIRIVPSPLGDANDPWFVPRDLTGNLPRELRDKARSVSGAIPGIDTEQALNVLAAWAGMSQAWKKGDPERMQEQVDRLSSLLPTLAAPEVYPAKSQRLAEARYYAWGKFTWGWFFYFLGAIAGVWALVTRWRTPRVVSMVFLIGAMGLHAYGIALRWDILGRIPVANMFEAVVASALVGIALALLAELRYKTHVFLVAANLTGFLALVLGGYVIPGHGTLTTIMGILDDVMLRIHTVLIIASYALIFVASVIALVYLFGYYFSTAPLQSLEAGLAVATMGVILFLSANFFAFAPSSAELSGIAKGEYVMPGFGAAAVASLVALVVMLLLRAPGPIVTATTLILLGAATVAIGTHGFITGMAVILFFGGAFWAFGIGLGLIWQRRLVAKPPSALAMAGGTSSTDWVLERPVLAGGAPGDETRRRDLPGWLHHVDWSHLIILNLVFVMLFIGTILGAVWADYSWGRPWGWDPKEVFALNTWIIYIILIHTRFFVKNKGLWTAWLSVAGCLMMVFNWCFVNFYIVGLHSYA
jgi:ABC-type transport system involved in cytochrome c biogenesis permease subunit